MNPRVRKTGPERRDEIARAVLGIVGEKGLQALTTTAVADRLGLTSGALFRHVASRDDMLRETAHLAAELIAETFPPAGGRPLQRLRHLARERVRLMRSWPGVAWLLTSDQATLSLPADAADALRGMVLRTRTFVLDAVEEGRRDGTIRRDVGAGELALVFVATVHALIGAPGVRRGEGADTDDRVERTLDAVDRLLAPPRLAGADIIHESD